MHIYRIIISGLTELDALRQKSWEFSPAFPTFLFLSLTTMDATAAAAGADEGVRRLVITELVMENFKSYGGRQRVGYVRVFFLPRVLNICDGLQCMWHLVYIMFKLE